MSDDLRWLLALIIGAIGALAAIVIGHIINDASHRERTAKNEEKLGGHGEKLEQHDHEIDKLRDKSHKHADEITALKARDFMRGKGPKE